MAGCQTSVSQEPQPQSGEKPVYFENGNILTMDNVFISLPEGWQVLTPDADLDPGIILRISGGPDKVDGYLQKFTADFDIPANGLVSFYMNKVFPGAFTQTERVNDRIVTGVNQITGKTHIIGPVSQGSQAYILEFIMEPETAITYKEQIYSVINSFELLDGQPDARHIKNSAGFRGYNTGFYWYSDYLDGFFITGRVNNQKNYIIYISLENGEEPLKPEEIHREQSIQSAFLYNIYFD